MILKDYYPISLVENKGFKLLIKTLAPIYKMPSRRSVSVIICKTINDG